MPLEFRKLRQKKISARLKELKQLLLTEDILVPGTVSNIKMYNPLGFVMWCAQIKDFIYYLEKYLVEIENSLDSCQIYNDCLEDEPWRESLTDNISKLNIELIGATQFLIRYPEVPEVIILTKKDPKFFNNVLTCLGNIQYEFRGRNPFVG